MSTDRGHKSNYSFVCIDRFKKDICEGHYCFVCANPLKKENKEHVVPKWILKRFNLFSQRITLPNKTRIQYGKYVIPCCQKCNSFLGKELETPISKAFSGGYESLRKHIKKHDYDDIYIWLALLYIKTHLKDKYLTMFLNQNQSNEKISEYLPYKWEHFHHIYSLSRIPFNRSTYDLDCIGSFHFTRILVDDIKGTYDYVDVTWAHTIGVIVGDVGVIAVFGDASAVRYNLRPTLEKITGPLAPIQFRELVASFAHCSLHLKNTPKHSTASDLSLEHPPHMICKIPIGFPCFEQYNQKVYGQLMEMCVRPLSDKTDPTLFDGSETFLFNDKGEFNEPKLNGSE